MIASIAHVPADRAIGHLFSWDRDKFGSWLVTWVSIYHRAERNPNEVFKYEKERREQVLIDASSATFAEKKKDNYLRIGMLGLERLRLKLTSTIPDIFIDNLFVELDDPNYWP